MKGTIKKWTAAALAAAMAVSMVGCGGGTSGSSQASTASNAKSDAAATQSTAAGTSKEGKTLNIWCWNDEFQGQFNKFYPNVKEVAKDKSTTTLKDGTVVKWTINPDRKSVV